MTLSGQQAEALAYFRSAAEQWRDKAAGRDGREVNVIAQRNGYVLHVADAMDGVGRFLDVGCGSGELVIAMASRHVPSVGIDFASEMINLARNAARSKGLVDAQFEVSSIDDYAPPHASFGLIAALGLIEYLARAEVERLLKRCRSWLREDGRLVVGSRNRLFNAFSLNSYTRAEQAIGALSRLVEEATAISETATMAECLAVLRAQPVVEVEMSEHPDTGIAVGVRHQYTPAQLVQILARHDFDAVAVSPAHYHGMTPRLKSILPEIHKAIAEGLQPSIIEAHVAVPFASTFLVSARPR
jgi:2-polyprenyl-3-methyl-5-hydroxy-6-metoxy-1,4-benzoquinol methylase